MEGDEPPPYERKRGGCTWFDQEGELTIGFLFRGGMKMSAPLAQK